jgi:hypothetical protein
MLLFYNWLFFLIFWHDKEALRLNICLTPQGLIVAHKDPTYEQVFSSCEPYNLVHLNMLQLYGLTETNCPAAAQFVN